MRRVAVILFLLIAALPFLLMVGQRKAARTGTRETAETLTILSPHRREIRLEYSRGFTAWMRQNHGRNVELLWLDVGGASKILKELESRFSATPDQPGVDLLFGGGVAPFLSAKANHWLAPLDLSPTTLADVPATCAGSPVYDTNHYWYGVTLSGFGILYNRPLIERLHLPVPSSWEALAHPAYYSWVGSGDPRSSGSVHMCYEIILQSYGYEKGWPIIARICANVRAFGEAGGTVPREVASGDIAAGMVIDQYAQTVIQAVGGNSLVLILPRQQTFIGPDPIAMITGTRHADLARMFVEYTLSPEGQRLLYQPAGVNGQQHSLYRMPVLKSLYAEAAAPRPNPYDFPAGLAYDNTLAMRRWNVLNDLIGVWLIDAHADLKSAWKNIIDKGCPPELAGRLGEPPVTEKELESLARTWNDPRLKQGVIETWSQAARSRYKTLNK